MRNAEEWRAQYGGSHRHPSNNSLLWMCVPIIVSCFLGFLWAAPFPGTWRGSLPLANWAGVVAVIAVLYYTPLSPRLALGITPLLILMLWSINALGSSAPLRFEIVCAVLFALAWVGQFVGHAIEGKRPSFFKDLQFLLIGPMWLLADLYRRAGIRY